MEFVETMMDVSGQLSEKHANVMQVKQNIYFNI